ncbi:hypothetical protein BD311DRAFT_764166 [Dichomitus squalens]|uniref:F-box domain-containing protein n=1 Tax=Dichomitus squalens TaxID=114155 RepID=A0A4Q9MEJ1_9APHY|nr:hypothetical protein BD311DRAFT_764166 [Dichomitus squalens]
MNIFFSQRTRAISGDINGSNHSSGPRRMQPHSPIFSLSDEELAMVFAEVVHDKHVLPSPYPLAPVVLSHVCLWWRGVALSTSSLWTRITNLSQTALDQYLFRSGNSPLTVWAKFERSQVHSLAIAILLIERAHRCKELHWTDYSKASIVNIGAFTTMSQARFAVLQELELASQEYISPANIVPFTRGERPLHTISFPALRSLSLCRVDPVVLRSGPMPELRTLKLQEVELPMSQLLNMISASPHLEYLTLFTTATIIDVHPVVGSGSSSNQALPNSAVRQLKLPIHELLWDLAPITDFWRLFQFIDMPSLQTLGISFPADEDLQRWVHLFGDVHAFASDEAPEVPIEFPELRSLTVEFDILDPSQPPSQFAHISYPNLEELHVAYKHRTRDFASYAAFPTPSEHPLFQERNWDNLRRLYLTHTKINAEGLCEHLAYDLPSLDYLGFDSCPGAGTVVCALACPTDPCLHDHRRPSSAHTDWLCLRLAILALIDCDDVRIDCVRNVIETRAFAAYGVHDVQARSAWGSSAFMSHVDKQENTPCRLEMLQIYRCAKVTEAGLRLLESLPGAPEIVFKNQIIKENA